MVGALNPEYRCHSVLIGREDNVNSRALKVYRWSIDSVIGNDLMDKRFSYKSHSLISCTQEGILEMM